MHVNLTYEQFVQELRNWIIKATHLPEDYVFFKKKEKTGITANGDRLFVVCAETDSGKEIKGIFSKEDYFEIQPRGNYIVFSDLDLTNDKKWFGSIDTDNR